MGALLLLVHLCLRGDFFTSFPIYTLVRWISVHLSLSRLVLLLSMKVRTSPSCMTMIIRRIAVSSN